MIGQQQAQARFDLRNTSNQQSGGPTVSAQQNGAPQAQPQADGDRRDVAVVAVLGYN